MHDFLSNDPVHLPFSKNEILDVIKQESSGWWAAMRRNGDTIGWIPQAFVKPLSDEMVDMLLNVREELRIFEYAAEQLYISAPVSRIPYEESEPHPPTSPLNAREFTSENSPQNGPERRRLTRPYPPPSPVTPMPQPPLSKFVANKPTPLAHKEPELLARLQDRGTRSSLSRRPLPPLTLTETSAGNDVSISPDLYRRQKIKKLTGSDEAPSFHDAILAQNNPPWYLRPRHADEIQTDADGKLISGTRIALVERLVWDIIPSLRDTHKAAQDTAYRRMFLTTFRTFMSPDDLFDMLVQIYCMSYPESLTESEFNDWRDRCLHPTQQSILNFFTMWLEEHRLLEEEPHISRRLNEFLELIKPPNPLAVTSQLIVQSITRLTFAPKSTTINSHLGPRKKQKTPKNDLLSIPPSDIADQLTLYEFKLYSKVTPQDCISQATRPSGCVKSRETLHSFCATHDKLAVFVTDTILSTPALSRRSDTVDHWIKVAEKCRNLNNFASLSAIINALSSAVISRLHLTWIRVGRRNAYEMLLKYNEPSGGFSGYRHLHLHAEGPCVPFIGMYLTELVHIKDQYSDEDGRVNMLQRQRWYEVILIMLRTQSKPYSVAENDTMKFIQNNLRRFASLKDWQSKFWAKSQEIQRSEFAHADIRRGLGQCSLLRSSTHRSYFTERAGF
jgi:son of sevenless